MKHKIPEAHQWPNQTSDEHSAGKKTENERKPGSPHPKSAHRDFKMTGKGLPDHPDSKPWIHNRVPDHDKSQRERGRY
jgi:hypothetical protein